MRTVLIKLIEMIWNGCDEYHNFSDSRLEAYCQKRGIQLADIDEHQAFLIHEMKNGRDRYNIVYLLHLMYEVLNDESPVIRWHIDDLEQIFEERMDS